MKRTLPNLLLMASVIGLDQLTKALVVRSLDLHEYLGRSSTACSA